MGGGEPSETDRTARRDDLVGREAVPGTARETGSTRGTARDAAAETGGAPRESGAGPVSSGTGALPPAGSAHGSAEARQAPVAAAGATPGAPGSTRQPADPSAPTTRTASLMPREETDKFGLRMQQAVSSFVDGPRAAIEEADHVLEEIAARFTEAVTQRRRTLRRSWESTDEATSASSDTEQLRLALRDYRELAERLLRH
ncbi:hypothetical protein IPT68_11185 [Streptomyces chromofuscus]|uniref:Uncharacterized protein n=2 Tax=Streptomyces chromofuscus TaxID=42881 RepID=A0A7M2TJU6_STRCW|nr:hypothetical protein IPT68_11185 [Streptomyces chromofuscus]